MTGHRIIPIRTGRFDGRSYLIISNDTKAAAVVDPDINLPQILAAIDREGAELRLILLTHGHYDHISSSDALREKTGAQVVIHRLDVPALSDPALNLTGPFGQPLITGVHMDRALEDGDVVEAGDLRFTVLHTPGHTPGSSCFLIGKDLITGDTLFRGTYGNTAFPGGDMGALMQSAARLLSLDEAIAIYPGHGDPSTIGRERVYNPISI